VHRSPAGEANYQVGHKVLPRSTRWICRGRPWSGGIEDRHSHAISTSLGTRQWRVVRTRGRDLGKSRLSSTEWVSLISRRRPSRANARPPPFSWRRARRLDIKSLGLHQSSRPQCGRA